MCNQIPNNGSLAYVPKHIDFQYSKHKHGTKNFRPVYALALKARAKP